MADPRRGKSDNVEEKNRQRGGGGGEGRGISRGFSVDLSRPTQFNVIVSELPGLAKERELVVHMRRAGVVKFESVRVRCTSLHYLVLLLFFKGTLIAGSF
jgi:hypothetical protein